MTNKMISQMMQQTFLVEDPHQIILKTILLFLFVSLLTSCTLGSVSWQTMFCGIFVPIKRRLEKYLKIPAEITTPTL